MLYQKIVHTFLYKIFFIKIFHYEVGPFCIWGYLKVK
jgi:hypothetical protein